MGGCGPTIGRPWEEDERDRAPDPTAARLMVNQWLRTASWAPPLPCSQASPWTRAFCGLAAEFQLPPPIKHKRGPRKLGVPLQPVESGRKTVSCRFSPAGSGPARWLLPTPGVQGVRSLRGMSPGDQPRDPPPPLHSSLVILGLQRLNGWGVLSFPHVTKSQPLGASPALTANPSDSLRSTKRKCPSQECMGRWTGQLPTSAART